MKFMNACIKVQCFECFSGCIRYPDQFWDYSKSNLQISRNRVSDSRDTSSHAWPDRKVLVSDKIYAKYAKRKRQNVKLMPPYVRDKSLKEEKERHQNRLLEQGNHQTLVIA